MTPDKLTPKDPRVQHNFAILNGKTYHYLLGIPSETPRATIFLIHGWPDMSFGWRYQVPVLLSMGLRVVVPDMMGYSQSSAPESLQSYTFKTAASDMAELAKHLNVPRIILFGHDWGGAVVYRIALWQPQLISAVISVCTPYAPPSRDYIPLKVLVDTVLPNFKYQIHLASGEVEQKIQTREQIKQFLNSLYGGRGPNGELGFTAKGVSFDNLPRLKPTPLLSEEELGYYADCYARNGMRGPLNWYRTRELNYEDEKEMAKVVDLKIKVPVLFVTARQDVTLPPAMSKGMGRFFDDLTVKEVDAGHWALWQRPEAVNKEAREFLERFLGSEGVKAAL